jgi:protease PrsW
MVHVIVTTIVMLLTGNPNLYPTVILIGNFLVPVVFVAFLYNHQHFSRQAMIQQMHYTPSTLP